jgi:hypothetical protein
MNPGSVRNAGWPDRPDCKQAAPPWWNSTVGNCPARLQCAGRDFRQMPGMHLG